MTKKTFFSVILLLVFGILTLWAFWISKSIMGVNNIVNNEPEIDEKVTLKELVITETKDGKKFWEVYADSGDYLKQNNQATLHNITGNFYKDDEIVLSVASPLAVYNNEKKEIKLKGGVEAANNSGIYIKADEICWIGTTDEIKAKGNVKIIREDQVMTESEESTFNTDFTNLKISGNSNTYVFSLH
ncbi:MAG TPA: LPS export ABC transporter periplasmic protein LptC [Candidatus Gastranaerophilales bacterium]|nr:LPS export ABC transporter periplasmic protein LptC [Candidatus Gastranaerophilales bacterium]